MKHTITLSADWAVKIEWPATARGLLGHWLYSLSMAVTSPKWTLDYFRAGAGPQEVADALAAEMLIALPSQWSRTRTDIP